MQSWQRAADRPDGCNGASQSPRHGPAMLSPLCTRGAAVREHPLTAQALGRCRAGQQNEGWLCPPRQKGTFMQGAFLGHLAPAGAPPGARKRSGKNLVFPRGPAAASASDMIVISALRRNNTPPMAQEGPSGVRRWEVRCPDSGVAPHPKLAEGCMRCEPCYSGAGGPSLERAGRNPDPVPQKRLVVSTRAKGTLMQRGVSGALGTGGDPAGRLEKGRGKT